MTDRESQIIAQIQELKDAVWCSRGELLSQNVAAAKRAREAEKKLKKLMNVYGIEKSIEGALAISQNVCIGPDCPPDCNERDPEDESQAHWHRVVGIVAESYIERRRKLLQKGEKND